MTRNVSNNTMLCSAILCICIAAGCSHTQPRPDRTVLYTSPATPPLWVRDMDAWVRQNPGQLRGRAIIATGEGRTQAQARSNVQRQAAQQISGRDPADLSAVGDWVVAYSDGMFTITTLFDLHTDDQAPDDIKIAATRLCAELLARIPQAERPDMKLVAVGDFTYRDTAMCSEFGELLRDEMLSALHAQIGNMATGRENLLQRFPADVVVRILDADAGQTPNAEAANAPEGLPDAVLTGTFRPRTTAGEVHVQASIRRPSGAVLGGASAIISLGGFDVAIEPSRHAAAEKNLAGIAEIRKSIGAGSAGAQNFKIELWAQDARRLWRQGERLVLHFRSDRDCHLNLLHIGPDDTVQLLFPNRWHTNTLIRAGQTYSIPSAAMGFDLIIRPPFGTDTIMAIATADDTAPVYRHQAGDIAFRTITERGIGVVEKDIRRPLAEIPPGKKAEAVITITTTGK